jgi:hypothetical protein
MPLERAPENRRTGIEINPNVRYPDQTEAAIGFTPLQKRSGDEACPVSFIIGRRGKPRHRKVFRCSNLTERTEV